MPKNYLLNDSSDEHKGMAETAYLMSPMVNEFALGLSQGPFLDGHGATGICWRPHTSGHKGKYLSLLKSYRKLRNGPKGEPACSPLHTLPHTPAVASCMVETGKIKSVRLTAPKTGVRNVTQLQLCLPRPTSPTVWPGEAPTQDG